MSQPSKDQIKQKYGKPKSKIAGKGRPRRKYKASNVGSLTQNEKQLIRQLKKLSVKQVHGIEEVNLFRNDSTVLHFVKPKLEAKINARTYVLTGECDTKTIEELIPDILPQLGTQQIVSLQKGLGNDNQRNNGDTIDEVPLIEYEVTNDSKEIVHELKDNGNNLENIVETDKMVQPIDTGLNNDAKIDDDVQEIIVKNTNNIVEQKETYINNSFNINNNNNNNSNKNNNGNNSNNNIAYTIPKATQKEQKIFTQASKVKKEQRNKCCIVLNKESIKKKIEVIKKAEQITNDILSKKPSGDAGKKDTVLHVFNKMLGGNALMYDSSKGINCPDNENILMNPNMNIEEKDPEFCVTLSSLDGESRHDSKIDENDTMIKLNKCIKEDKSHPILHNFKEKIAKAYNIEPNQVIIKDVYAGTVNIVYVLDLTEDQRKKYFKKDGSGNITETPGVINKMSEFFRDFQSLNLPAIFYRNSFDIGMFDDRGNKTFSSGTKYKVGPKGREKEYIQPTGWVRYGLKVLNKYPDKKWLAPFQDPGNWYRVYHGTGSVQHKTISGYGYNKITPVDAMANIYKGGFHMAGAIAYGPGVYCSPNPQWLELNYCGRINIDTQNGPKTYKYMLQCGVNPDQVRCGDSTNHSNKTWSNVPFGSSDIFEAWGPIWVAQNPDSIRAYGILIKEI